MVCARRVEEQFLFAGLSCVSNRRFLHISTTYCQVLDVHLLVPESRKLKELLPLRIFDETADRVVRATEIAPSLEFEVRYHSSLRASNVCVIAEFVLHRAKEDTAGVHVRLRDEAGSVSRYSFGMKAYSQSFAGVEYPQDCNALHHTGCRVSQELASRLQTAVYADVVIGRHEEVAGLGRVVRGLLGDVVALGAIRVVPVSCKDFTENRI